MVDSTHSVTGFGARHCSRLIFAAVAGALVLSFAAVAAVGKDIETTERDSLVLEMRRLSNLVTVLSDSLGIEQRELIDRASGDEVLDLAFEDLSEVVTGLTSELAQLDLKITDRTFSLRDETGGSIIEFEVPEDLGERLSEGIATFSEALISELPDDVSLDDLSDQWAHFYKPDERRHPRRVVHGDRVKFGDNIEVTEDEEIDGSVWACFSSVDIYGKVDGDVLVMGGDVFLDEDAEVTGQVITVFGSLDQDKDAVVEGQIFVFDPSDEDNSFAGLRSETGFLSASPMALMFEQAGVLLVSVLVLVSVNLLPTRRRRSMFEMLRYRTVACFGYGLLVQIAVAILVVVLLLTIIGIPLALLVILAALLLTILALVPVSVVLGGWLVKRLGSRQLPDWVLCLIGLTLLHFFSFWSAVGGLVGGASSLWTGLLYVGSAVKLFAACLGVGTLVGSRFGSSPAVSAQNELGENTQ